MRTNGTQPRQGMKSSRSKIELFRKDFITLARKSASAYASVSDSERVSRYFLNYLKDEGIKLRSTDSLKVRYFEGYIQHRKNMDISDRTLQNEMSVFRRVLHAAGKYKLADPDHDRLSNKALGISDVNRDGKKIALSGDVFHKALSEVEKKDEGAAAVMLLAYTFGLRTKEAMESCKSISTWKQAVERGDKSVRVVFGTKGGRPRDTTIIDHQEAKRVINIAERVAADNNGKFIDRPLHKAIDRYRYLVRKAGLTGAVAPHSMRYNFAKDVSAFHESNGFNKQEVLAMVSMDLGHGDGRGRYIKQVYYRNAEPDAE
ncbi:integrase domain-containing protein [Erwinia amylovora]|uniref:integrase domain-containing protein n=1 Tax=Erwinia amylovora TaxID=552 RepID=UPI001F048CFE|nr:integrase domain-containing protein [Erwinia amylovora]